MSHEELMAGTRSSMLPESLDVATAEGEGEETRERERAACTGEWSHCKSKGREGERGGKHQGTQ